MTNLTYLKRLERRDKTSVGVYIIFFSEGKDCIYI